MHTLKNTTPTSTGNELGFWGYYRVATWQDPIGPISEMDLQHAEALEIDRTNFPNVHIHWEDEGRDCDGGHSDYGIIQPDDRYKNGDGSVAVSEFWQSEFQWLASASAIDGVLKVTGDPYDDTDRTANWSETTEEGYRARGLRLCTDNCERPVNTVYDEYAQNAGY